MKEIKKMLSLILAVAMVLSMVAMFAGCNNNPDTTDPSDSTGNGVSGETGTYVVKVKTIGGMAMSDINVYIYEDGELKNMGKTDADGKASFDLPKSENYVVDLEGVPEGYDVKESYPFTGNTANITLVSSLIKGESLSGASLGLGDVMYDFEVTTTDGKKFVLSEVLAEKKMVLLNFFFTTCGPCANEFPYMHDAYKMYQEKAEVIALDPLEEGAAVAGYQQTMGLTFPMAACQPAWSQTFGITGYPTSIVVDRYGVICLIEVGGLTSMRPFTSIFEHFTSDDYEQKVFTSLDQLVTNVKPNVEMPSSDEIGAVINKGDINVTYRPETEGDSAEYSWPFVIGEKNGEACVMSSNKLIEASFAIMYADVELKAGQAVGFDYLVSSERGSDVMHVIVNDEPIYTISGVSEPEEWKSAYPWVASKDGTYEVALCYIKDDSTDEGDDTVYIKNMRIVDASEINVATYIPSYPASSEDGFEYTYEEIFLNEKDGYYHVGSKNGPLLLVEMMDYTQFNEDKTLWDIAYNGDLTVDGHNYYDDLVDYFSYASNSSLNGVCTVNKELAELLKKVDQIVGFDEEDEYEWLKMCKYYQAYGTKNEQLEDPIKGLAPFSAYEAKLGKNVSTNVFYYNTAIIPRGKLAKFVPSKSGVYRITSSNESAQGVNGWIFNRNREELLTYEMDERLYNDDKNVSMLYYMEAGEAYYIDIAFWDVYEVGYIYYDIEYVGKDMELFRLASPGYFTYDSDATGDAMYHLIAGGIDVVLGPDGKYYEDKGKDANGKQIYGSLLYADFTGVTSLFSSPIASVNSYDENGKLVVDKNGNPVKINGMIDMGGFDFSKTENDLYILAFLKKYNNDVDATKAYLKDMWGEDFDAYAQEYQIEDVFAGKYHGKGEDLTAEISTYLSKMYKGSAKERVGCVVVDERLAEILQLLMEKYTFENVDHAWTKLCYYYDYLGPEG